MRVCVDVQSAVAQRAGVGRYTKSLVDHLPALQGDDELALFWFDFMRKGSPFPEQAVHERVVRWCPGRVVQKAWKTVRWPPFDLLAGDHDVYHFPNFIIPPLSGGKAVVTIHDMGFMRFPLFTEEKNLNYLEKRIKPTVKRADAVITVSEFSADEIAELLPIARDRIVAIHEGIDPKFRPQAPESVTHMREELGLDRPYLLIVGTIEPRKNLPLAIEVFERMPEFDGTLVVVGGRGWRCESLFERMATSSRASDIRYIGYVEDHQIVPLYAGAELFLFPSFYEGFGFPPLEAMACGTPVVSSAGGSLAEVLGDGAVVLNAFDSETWVENVRRVLADSGLKEALVNRGRAQASSYTWEATARKTWDVYRGLLDDGLR